MAEYKRLPYAGLPVATVINLQCSAQTCGTSFDDADGFRCYGAVVFSPQ